MHANWCLWLPIIVFFLCMNVDSLLHRYYCHESIPGIGYIESYSVSSGRGGAHCHLKVFYQVDDQWYLSGFSMSLDDFKNIDTKKKKDLQIPIKISSIHPDYISFY